jgi:hypothetical protein
LECFHGTAARLAEQVIGSRRIQFPEALGQEAQRKQRHTLDAGEPVLVRLAHVKGENVRVRIGERALEILNGHFVRVRGSRGDGRLNAAELFVVHELADPGVCAAHGAFRVAAHLDFAESHLQGVVE